MYVLLDACKILKERGYKFVCNFVGGESKEVTREIFEKAVEERGLKEYTIYNGPKYGKDKIAFFTNADIFIQPTLNDCFPLTLLEAMQYKLPIITTNEGGIPDIVENAINGYVCERENSESLANSLEILLTDKEKCIELGENGYKIFSKKFTLSQFNKNIFQLLSDLIVK